MLEALLEPHPPLTENINQPKELGIHNIILNITIFIT